MFDLAFASERRFERQDRKAVRLPATVAAAFAYLGIDEDASVRVGILALLATAALLGRTGLVVDETTDALDLAQAALNGIQFAAVMKRSPRRKEALLSPVLFRLIAHDREFPDPLSLDLARDALYADHSVDRLTAGHRNCVVVKHLVGDVGFSGDRLPDCQRPGVEVRAVPKVLEHVGTSRESTVSGPVHAFATHLDQPGRAAVHP